MNHFLTKLLEKWIAIPRSLRMGFLTLIVLGFLLFLVGKGIFSTFHLFDGSSTITWPTIILALILAFIILLIINRRKKN